VPCPPHHADGEPSAGLARPTHVLFELGGERFACELAAVREVVPFGRVTRLPGAPSSVCGLMNLRGTVVTVVDLGARLGGAPVDRGEGVVLLVSRDTDGASGVRVAGLAVDLVHDVPAHTATDAVCAGGSDGSARFGGPLAASLGAAWLGLALIGGEPVVLLDVRALVRNVLI
jgi:purine-binding chemotaxis protein CheW